MKSLVTFLAGAVLAVSASATTITFSSTNALQTTDFTQSMTLGLFDSSLGTLTGVSLVVSAEMATTLGLANGGSTTQTAKATSTADVSYGSSILDLTALLVPNPLVTLVATTGFQTLGASASYSTGLLTLNGSKSFSWSAVDPILSSLTGTGNFSIDCSTSTSLALSGGGGQVNQTQSTQAACAAEIVYTYDTGTKVPEPATLGLMGLAGLGMAALRRRRKQ